MLQSPKNVNLVLIYSLS